jgi:hypothetical protein
VEGPSNPGYYESVTGVRPVPDGPGKGPTHLYGQVHRYGRQVQGVRRWVRIMLWLPLQDVECVWTGPLIPVPNDPADPAWQQAMRECERQASAQAKRFQRLDPDARGGIR